MKRIVLFSLIAGALFMGVVSSPLSGLARFVESRTSNELSLFLLLNGERSRPVQSDGGGLMLYTADAGMASITVTGGLVYYVENTGSVAFHLCTSGPEGTWDGGCNTTPGDPNYGSKVAVDGYRWISTRDATTTLRAVPASGASVAAPVSIMR